MVGMVSGNFLVGKELNVRGFQKYVMPLFKERGVYVPERLWLPSEKSILTSISFDADIDLEDALSRILVLAGQEINLDARERPGECTAYEFQVSAYSHLTEERNQVNKGIFQTLGIYGDSNMATQLFPLLAQGYLMSGYENRMNKFTQQIRELGRRLSE